MTTAGQSDVIPLGNSPAFVPDKKIEDEGLFAHDPIELVLLFRSGPNDVGVYHSFFVPFVYNWDSLTMWTGDLARIPLDIPWLDNREEHCAAGPIGCHPAKDTVDGLFALHLTAWRQLEIDANQPDGRPPDFSPMGEVIPVREEPTFVMLATCLLVLGLLHALLAGCAAVRRTDRRISPAASPTSPIAWSERWRR